LTFVLLPQHPWYPKFLSRVKILIKKMMALQFPLMNPMISQESQRTHLYFAEIEHVVGKN
jgi:hypothetical protein